MARYDVESLVNEVKAVLVANLNTRIAAINVEKADAVVLDEINDDAYMIQFRNGTILNFNPFVAIEVAEIGPNSAGPYAAQEVTVNVFVVFEDRNEDVDVASRMYRYMRALKDAFETNGWYLPSGSVKLEATSLAPITLPSQDGSVSARVAGIALTTVVS